MNRSSISLATLALLCSSLANAGEVGSWYGSWLAEASGVTLAMDPAFGRGQGVQLWISDTGADDPIAAIVDGDVRPAQALTLQSLQRARVRTGSLGSGLPGRRPFPGISYTPQLTSTPNLSSSRTARSSEVVSGFQAALRATTDVANLLDKANSTLSVGTQRRNPIVNEPRVRGGRVGSQPASGSHWVAARIDLDTVLSKVDSRIVEETTVITGPYSARLGPGFEFIDISMLPAPRFDSYETHGSTSFDFKSNGENWYGRRSFWGGDRAWGYRVAYGHRTGNDYESGDGTQIPSGFKSRDWDFALGLDLTAESGVDFHYLRLDQTDLELPGQAFDIDYLVTDGYDVTYRTSSSTFDFAELQFWYNRTRFEGSASSEFAAIGPSVGVESLTTDVDSMSVGYQLTGTSEHEWGTLSVGTDLRYVNQELNELATGGGFTNANSPIPRSYSANPGLFADVEAPLGQYVTGRIGGRIDWTVMDVVDDVASTPVTPQDIPYGFIVGTDDLYQAEPLVLIYADADARLSQHASCGASIGFGQRSPNLTERYAAEPFMFLLQNGLNTVTGDPTLAPEQRWQIDLRYTYRRDKFRSGVNGFAAWMRDYITFERTSVELGPPFNDPIQVNLKYVNTSLATLAGVEWFMEADVTSRITPFVTLRYVEGTDRSRSGDFATRPADAVTPSTRDESRPRGYYGRLPGEAPGEATEPLPGIVPFESRIGLAFHPRRSQSGERDDRWGTELSVRIAAAQDRVAASLLEMPTPGFAVWDLRSFFRPRQGLLLTCGIENFTDSNYFEHLDFRTFSGRTIFQPGMNAYVGAELAY